MALAVDARRQRADLGFQRLDRLPRHRFLEHHADLGEVVAQVSTAASMPQGRMVSMRALICAKLLLEVGQASGSGRAASPPAAVAAPPSSMRCARFDLGQRLVERSRPGRH